MSWKMIENGTRYVVEKTGNDKEGRIAEEK